MFCVPVGAGAALSFIVIAANFGPPGAGPPAGANACDATHPANNDVNPYDLIVPNISEKQSRKPALRSQKGKADSIEEIKMNNNMHNEQREQR